MMQMQDIKDRVTKVLDNKGVLSRLKAELRANVFLAINDQDIQQGGIGLASKSDAWNREQLLQDPSGAVVVELVREFLSWCRLQFTIPVFEPEMQLQYAALDRHSLQQQLGLSGINGDMPLLLQLLQQYTVLAGQQVSQSSLPAVSQQPPTSVAFSQLPLQQHIVPDDQDHQQQHNQHQQPAGNQPAAGTLDPAPALHTAAAAKQPSKSASIMEEIDMDENLISTKQHGEPDEDEEYAAVFLAAQSPTEPDDEVSSTDTTPTRQQIGRPLLWTQPQAASVNSSNERQALPPPAVATISSPPAYERSDSGDLDLSIELHEPSDHNIAGDASQQLQLASHAAALPAAKPVPAVVTDIPSTGHSLVLQQQSVARSAGPALAALPAGRLSPLDPLGPLRAGKLAPLAPIARPSGLATANTGAGKSTASSEGLRDELRRAGLLQSPDTPASQHSTEVSNLGGRDSPGNTSSDRLVDAFVQQETTSMPAGLSAAANASEVDVGLYSDGEQQLQGIAESPAADYTTAAAQNPGRPVYGSTAGGDFSSSDDDSSDDFGIEVQRQLFEAARRQLSQGSAGHSADQQQQQQMPQQQPSQQHESAGQAGQQQPEHDDDAEDFGGSDLDIPEDFSLPLEGLDEDDEDTYAHMLEGAGQHTAAPAAVAADTFAGRGNAPQQQLGGMSLGDTGLSLSDIGNLPTAADFQLDTDEF